MKELPKLTEEDINEIVKEHYGFSVDEADEMIGKLSLRVKQLEYNNEKLNHYKLLYQKVKDRNDRAIEYLEDWKCPKCDKDTMRDIMFSSNKENALEILKGNNEE